MDDEARFIAETQEEAHYWFVLSDVADLSLKHGLDKVLVDMIQLMKKRRKDD